jgi:LysR family transcriptional regulator, low CO2-responsive transcriptional regulator
VLERIDRQEDDLYILGEPPATMDAVAYPLVPNPLVMMASRKHHLVGVPNIPLKRLMGEPFIFREPGSGTRDSMMRAFESHGLKPPVPRMELSSNEAIKQAIAANLGISVLSLHALGLEGTSGPIAILDVQNFPLHRVWYVAHPTSKRISVAGQAFLDFVKLEGEQIAKKFEREIAKIRAHRPAKARRGGKRVD